MVNSPFKFLNPYEAKDKAIFFGRDSERDTLINLLHASNLIMVYGLSGTGKTSLLRSGLSQKLDVSDWFPITTVRKKDDLIESLREEICKFLPENQKEVANDEPITAILHKIYCYYLRPIYLIFDQFEEIFTAESSLEQGFEEIKKKKNVENKIFFEEIKKILESGISCKIIFCIREEYIGQLYPYEEIFPNLFDYKLRVEPMTRKDLVEVNEKTIEVFNIKTEIPINEIVDKLLEGNAEKQLAYLQVYLDSLWQAAYQEKSTENWYGKIPDVTITKKIFDEVGDVGKVLRNYFFQQNNIIKTQIGAALKEGEWREFEKDILGNFITNEGTKQPVLYVETEHQYHLKNAKNENLTLTTDYINALMKARIIRKEPSFFELSHDSLAQIIFNNRSEEDILVRNIEQNISGSYQLYKNNNGGILAIEIINIYDKFKHKISTNKEIEDYVEVSRKENSNKISELEAKNIELEKTNNALKKSKAKVFYALFAFFVTVSAFVGSYFGYKKIEENEIFLSKLTRNTSELFKKRLGLMKDSVVSSKNLTTKRNELIAKGDFAEALNFHIGNKLISGDTTKDEKPYADFVNLYVAKDKADDLYQQGSYKKAIETYQLIKEFMVEYGSINHIKVDTNAISEKIFSYNNSKAIWHQWEIENKDERDSATTKNIELLQGTLNILPFEIVQKYRNINRVQFNGNKFSDFPVNLFLLPKLEIIYLNENSISQIPDDIRYLRRLRVLSHNNNKFLEFPKSVCHLKSLTNLNLAGNRILALPKEIGELKNLNVLTLSNNQFEELPAEIFLLPNLRQAYFNDCQINCLPAYFFDLLQKSKINELYLRKNPKLEHIKQMYNANGEKIKIFR